MEGCKRIIHCQCFFFFFFENLHCFSKGQRSRFGEAQVFACKAELWRDASVEWRWRRYMHLVHTYILGYLLTRKYQF